MEWLDSIRRGRKQRKHTFLCTGAIGDGFPPPIKVEDTLDTLVSWDECVNRYFPHVHGWTFDPARGFIFHNEETKKWFEKPTKEKQPDGNQNTLLAMAQQAIQQQKINDDLPIEPEEALRLMRRILDKKVSMMSLQNDKHVWCMVILPDVHMWCEPSINGNPKSAVIALLLDQMLCEERYRKAGIVFFMSAPFLVVLHERLRRPDLPVCYVRIAAPCEDERFQFLHRLCCDPEGLLQARMQEMLRLKNATIKWDTRAIDAELGEITLRKIEVYAKTQELQAKSPQLQRADAELDAARNYLQQACDMAVARKNAEEPILCERLKRLERWGNSTGKQPVPLSQSVWMRISVGDRIRFSKNPVRQRAVLEVRDNVAVLSELFDLSKPEIGKFRLPIIWMFRNGELVGTEQNNQGIFFRLASAEMYSLAVPEYINSEIVDVQDEIDSLEMKIKELGDVDKFDTVQSALIRVRTSESELSQIKMELLKDSSLEFTKLELREEALAKTRNEITSSPRIKRLNDEIIELQKNLIKKTIRLFSQPEDGIQTAAHLLQGLGYRQIVMLMRSVPEDHRLTVKRILEARIDLLRTVYGHLFEIIDPLYGFEGIGGLNGIKEFFSSVRDAIVRDEVRAVPMGVLLMGPPGTGKTAIAEAFARECGFLFVRVKNTRSMWVGESERQSEELFSALRDLAPVVVLRDEVDQEDSGRDSFQGDSGVSARLRGAWMQFLSDPKIRGRIFVVSCTNRPDLMDPALKRSGRTDERIPVLMPDVATREAVFAVMVKRYKFESVVESYAPYAQKTNGLSGADIEVIVRRAYGRAINVGEKAINHETLCWAIDDFAHQASQAQIARMTLCAIAETSSRRFLPPNVAEIVAECCQTLGEQSKDMASSPMIILVPPPPSQPVETPSKDKGKKENEDSTN